MSVAKVLRMFPETATAETVAMLCEEIEQLRAIAREQHEVLLAVEGALDPDEYNVTHPLVVETVAKYEAMIKS